MWCWRKSYWWGGVEDREARAWKDLGFLLPVQSFCCILPSKAQAMGNCSWSFFSQAVLLCCELKPWFFNQRAFLFPFLLHGMTSCSNLYLFSQWCDQSMPAFYIVPVLIHLFYHSLPLSSSYPLYSLHPVINTHFSLFLIVVCVQIFHDID